jgi:hypothetical protein
MKWGSLDAHERQYSAWLIVPVIIALALLCYYFVNYTPYFPVNDPPSVSSWPPPAGLYGTAVASLQILGVSLGIATKPFAALCGFAIFALGFVTAAILIQCALRRPAERLRALGLLLFLGAAAVLVFVIARSRAGMGLDYVYRGHYLILVVPALCCIYFAWEIHGGFVTRLIQFGLMVVLAALVPLNLRAAIQIGKDLKWTTAAFERDVQKGIPASVLAERYFASDVMPRADKLAMILKYHKANGIGIFKKIRDDPEVRVETVDPGAAFLDHIIVRDGIASSAAHSPTMGSLTWTLDQPRHVYAIRLHYAYIQAANPWPTLHAYWRNSALQDFNSTAVSSSTVAGPDQATWALINGKIQTNGKVRTERILTIWVDTTIDQFRIYLESAPCEVRFSRIELLLPPS